MILLMVVASFTQSAIEQISSIHDSEKYFESSGEKILGIFDIDETLLIPEDPAFQKPTMKKHAAIVQGLKEQLSIEQQDLLSNLSLTSTSSLLIESTAPLLIKNLQAKEIRLIALTAVMTRPFGIDYLPKRRSEELLRKGIDFSFAFPEIKELHLTCMKRCNQSVPVFYSGVLCSNGDYLRQKNASSKGKALCELLKQVAWIPNKIIFVDDKLYNLEEMEQTLSVFDPTIVYHGLHYLGAKSITSPPIEEELFEAKWKELMEKVKFFSQVEQKKCCAGVGRLSILQHP